MTPQQMTAAGVVAGLILAAAIALTIFLRRRRASREPASASKMPEPSCDEVVQVAFSGLAAGNRERATYSLASYIDRAGARDRRQQPWDLLLDLYYHDGDRERYQEIAERYRRTFGTQLPAFESWPEYFSSPASLEQGYPRLMDELRRRWRNGNALAFVDGILDQLGRPGRPALSGTAVRELVLLRDVLVGRDKARERSAEQESSSGANDAAGGSAGPEETGQGGGYSEQAGSGEARPSAGLAKETLAPEAYQSPLEARFERIANLLEQKWPGKAALEYLDSLIIDERGSRAGFPPDVMAEILLLREIISRRHPPGTKEVWHKIQRGEDS